ncbi:MAG: DUF29 domain-containing protein [Candidatus Magnetoovum sp. WYHC-5]|nr:DUF29 domain-containing protein [Candidatus Magnetoovum sp. WYHC-5]
MDNPNTITHITNTTTEQSLYERDFYEWGLYNAELLRQGRLSEIDIENIAEELESMSRRDKREVGNRLKLLIAHLLKWQYQSIRRSNSWRSTISDQRAQIKYLIKDSPSLKHSIEVIISESFEDAKVSFEDETGISQKHLPFNCPYSFEQMMDNRFWPEETII